MHSFFIMFTPNVFVCFIFFANKLKKNQMARDDVKKYICAFFVKITTFYFFDVRVFGVFNFFVFCFWFFILC